MNESKRLRGIEIHLRSAVQEDYNLEPLLKRHNPLSEAAVAHGLQL